MRNRQRENENCLASKAGRKIGQLWSASNEKGSTDQTRHLYNLKSHMKAIEVIPATSLAGALAKLAMVVDTVDDVFHATDDSQPVKSDRERRIQILLADAITVVEMFAGTTVKTMGLEPFYCHAICHSDLAA